MSKQDFGRIFFDNTFVKTVEAHTGESFNYERFLSYFGERFQDFTIDFFCQKTEDETWGEFNTRLKELEGFGIKCHLPYNTSLHRASYAPALESSSLMAEAMVLASYDFEDNRSEPIIFAVTHMSYIPFIEGLKVAFGVKVELVFDEVRGNSGLAAIADKIYPSPEICY